MRSFFSSFGFSKKSGLHAGMTHEQAFAMLDKDGGGSISADELKAAFTKGGSSLSESEIQRVINQVDANGDGELQMDEVAMAVCPCWTAPVLLC